jgi:hypothetical protein
MTNTEFKTYRMKIWVDAVMKYGLWEANNILDEFDKRFNADS